MKEAKWIGVDLDGTLAEYESFIDEWHIGKPIWPMVQRVKRWIAEGHDVRIFTARISFPRQDLSAVIINIQNWLSNEAGLPRLQVTNLKDHLMDELWDDRVVTVEKNTGRVLGVSSRGLS